MCRMQNVYDTFFTEPVIHTHKGDLERMTAALAVAREGCYTLSEIGMIIDKLDGATRKAARNSMTAGGYRLALEDVR